MVDGGISNSVASTEFLAGLPKTPMSISCWEGSDEMDEARGEIYAEIDDGELRSTIEFFNGDESEFRAVTKSVARKVRTKAQLSRPPA
jgi:hypothetical protein